MDTSVLREPHSTGTKDQLRFITCGSVDDGKSTLIGRLLHDSKSIFEDQLEHIAAVSKKRGTDYVDLALLTDGLRAEREQGITIDVASTASSWSSKIALESSSRRPIRVDLPSSTEPAVANRSRSIERPVPSGVVLIRSSLPSSGPPWPLRRTGRRHGSRRAR